MAEGRGGGEYSSCGQGGEAGVPRRSRDWPNIALDNYKIACRRLPTHRGAILANGGDVRNWPEGGLGEYNPCGQGG